MPCKTQLPYSRLYASATLCSAALDRWSVCSHCSHCSHCLLMPLPAEQLCSVLLPPITPGTNSSALLLLLLLLPACRVLSRGTLPLMPSRLLSSPVHSWQLMLACPCPALLSRLLSSRQAVVWLCTLWVSAEQYSNCCHQHTMLTTCVNPYRLVTACCEIKAAAVTSRSCHG